MADSWNTDTGEAVYRTQDALKNIRIRVQMERLTSTASLSQHLQQQLLSQQQEKTRKKKRKGDVELEALSTPPQKGDNEEELVLGWQEKLFSQSEYELYQNKHSCRTLLEDQYHAEVTALSRGEGRRNIRIFTYTDHDDHTHRLPSSQTPCPEDSLTTSKSGPTLLEQRMANVRHRRQDRHLIDLGIPKTKLINWEPSEEWVRSSHMVTRAMQSMQIMADLGPPGRLGEKKNECLLMTIKTDGSGTIIVKPDFNKGKEPYRIVTTGDKKEVWSLRVENVSVAMVKDDHDKELHMYRDLYVRHKEYLNSLVGSNFEMPPPGTLRYVMNGEIVSAKGFEYDNLYIHFFMELPNNWSSLPFHPLSGVTQTCRTKAVGKDDVAFFSFPFNFEAFYMSEKESDGIPQWPVLYFKVLSLDFWQRYRTEGYGYLLFPAVPGKHRVTCGTWRPLQTATVSALRRFFIGGSPELEEPSYVRVPGTFKGERLSRFGFSSESSGSVTFNLHCIQQAHAFVDAIVLKKRREKVVEQLGGFSQQGAVYNILEAFQKARRKMQEAREGLPQTLINATSKLEMNESNA
ncbi:unnamed protein product [Knipowitschia caucasica]|uniref:MKS transition zone complex subunit 1 n=1 Tax=Knipowitschia caucasica TaxID=637954 RepID=A0AAV2JAW4_KNICA